MHHLRLALVGMDECGQYVTHDRDLLIEGKRQRALLDVLPHSVPRHVLRDQDEAVLGLVRKQVPHGEDVRVSG